MPKKDVYMKKLDRELRKLETPAKRIDGILQHVDRDELLSDTAYDEIFNHVHKKIKQLFDV